MADWLDRLAKRMAARADTTPGMVPGRGAAPTIPPPPRPRLSYRPQLGAGPRLPVYVEVDETDPTVLRLRENGALIGLPDRVAVVTTRLLDITVGEDVRYTVTVELECVTTHR